MKRVWAWVGRFWGVGAAAVAVALALHVAVLPAAVHWVVVRVLAGMGLPQVRLELRGVSPFHAEVANFAVGDEGRVRVGALGVSFSPWSLLHGRVKTIEVTGAELEVRLRGGVLDLGPLASLKTEGQAGELPLGRVELRSCSVLLDLEGERLRVPVEGSVADAGAGKAKVDIAVEAEGALVRVTGVVDSNTYDADLQVDVQVKDAGGLVRAVPASVVALPGHVNGRLSLKAAAERVKGEAAVSVAVKAEGMSVDAALAGHTLAADGVSLRMAAKVHSPFRVDGLDVAVRAERVDADGVVACPATLTLRKEGGELRFEGAAAGEAWKLTKLAGTVSGVFEALVNKKGPITAEITLEGEGRLPRAARAMLLEAGLTVEDLGRVVLAGRARASAVAVAGGWRCEAELPEVRATLEPGSVFVRPVRASVRDLSGDVRLAAKATADLAASTAGGKDGVRWEATVSELRATLGVGEVASSLLGVGVRRLAVEARLAAKADGNGARVELLPESGASLGEVTVRLGEFALALGEAGKALAELKVSEQPCVLQAQLRAGKLAWEATAPDVRAELACARVPLPFGGVALEGVAGRARLQAAASPQKAQAELRGGSRLAVGALRIGGTAVQLAKADPKADWLLAELGEAGAQASLSLGGEKAAWRLSVPEARVGIAEQSAAIGSELVKVEGVGGLLAFGVTGDADGLTVSPLEGSHVAFRALEAKLGGQSARVGGARAVLGAKDGLPLVHLSLGADGLAAKVAWRVASDGPVAVALWDGSAAHVASAKLGTIRSELAAGYDAKGLSLQSSVAVEGIEASLKRGLGRWTVLATTSGGSLRLAFDGRSKAAELAKPTAQASLDLNLGQGQASAEAEGLGSAQASFGKAGFRTSLALGATGAAAPAGTSSDALSVAGGLSVEGVAGSLKGSLAGYALAGSSSGGSLGVTVEGSGSAARLPDLAWQARFALESGKAQATAKGESLGDLEAALAKAGASGTLTLEDRKSLAPAGLILGMGRTPVLQARAGLEGASLKCPAKGLAVSGVAAEMPVSWNVKEPPVGKFAVESLQYGMDLLPPLAGTLRMADWEAKFAATWPLLKGATLEASGRLDVGSGVPRGELKALVPRFEIGDDNQPGTLLAALRGLTVRGAASLDARVSLIGDRIDPRITLKLDNGQVSSQQYDATAEGVKAAITINSLSPLTTPGNQRIDVKRARLGSLKVEDGFITFRLDDLRKLLIERTSWGWAGGRLYSYAFYIDPFSPAIDLVVYADHLKLADILALLPEGHATGEGTLYGRLPVTIEWPDRLAFGDGFLYATPGKGVLQVAEAKVVGQLMEAQDPRFARDPNFVQLKTMLVGALQDFEYSVLKTDFVMEGSNLVARIHVQGKGRQGAHPVEIGSFNLNINGFDKILSGAMIKMKLQNPGF